MGRSKRETTDGGEGVLDIMPLVRTDRNKPILGWRRTEADKFVERGFEKLVPFGNGLFGRELKMNISWIDDFGHFFGLFLARNGDNK